jgi:hypothetical protein
MLCPSLPRDRPLTTGKRRFAYSLTVVHFRKLRKARKVGSGRNGRPNLTAWLYGCLLSLR